MNIINKKLPLIALTVIISSLSLTACGGETTTKAEPKVEKGQDPLNKSVNNIKDKANAAVASSEEHNKQLEENTQ